MLRFLLLKGGTFNASLVDNGIMVDNLGSESFLPWEVFTEVVALLQGSGGQASRGDAMNSKLGEPDLYITSVEGFIAHKVYNKQPGDSVFRRITHHMGRNLPTRTWSAGSEQLLKQRA